MNVQSHQLARERLRTALESRQMSQNELSRLAGIRQSDLSRLVRGVRPVSADHAEGFARALGKTPGYWLGEEQPAPVVVKEKRYTTEDVHPGTGQIITGLQTR